MQEWIIHIDGGSRGNPGPAAFAYTIERPGEADVERKECIGTATNNIAEYTALVRALEHAVKLGARRAAVLSDSELLVQQMRGNYRVKNEGIIPLHAEANRHAAKLENVTFQHVPRAQNARADALCNAALDGDRPAAPKKKQKSAAKLSDERLHQVRGEAIECLRNAASAWAHGSGQKLTAEQVWDQLASILEEAGLLPTK